MFQTKLMNDYLYINSYVGAFISALLLMLTCAFSNISKIINYRTFIYVSTFLDHYYVEYYMNCDDYDLCVFYPNESGEAK